jgi:hypothetical protein
MNVRPIFVFSVSRSGSTLVQRIIGAHKEVATAQEPWILLPFLYAMRREGTITEYVQPLLVEAMEDFCDQLPGGREDYRNALHDFAMRLYETSAGEESRFFLDKSPPYYLIAEEIMSLFPEGRFVFLWRNPLSIVASIIDTWQEGHWHPTMYRSDLFIGLPRLVAAYEAHSANAYSARFEDLVGGDEAHWQALMEYLGIEFDPRSLRDFAKVTLPGRMGDPTGTKRYTTLSTDPTEKWKKAFENPLRRAWCRRYLRFLGSERLEVMGYPLQELLLELDSQPSGTAWLARDLVSLVADIVKEPVRVRIRRQGLGGPNVIRELLRS